MVKLNNRRETLFNLNNLFFQGTFIKLFVIFLLII